MLVVDVNDHLSIFVMLHTGYGDKWCPPIGPLSGSLSAPAFSSIQLPESFIRSAFALNYHSLQLLRNHLPLRLVAEGRAHRLALGEGTSRGVYAAAFRKREGTSMTYSKQNEGEDAFLFARAEGQPEINGHLQLIEQIPMLKKSGSKGDVQGALPEFFIDNNDAPPQQQKPQVEKAVEGLFKAIEGVDGLLKAARDRQAEEREAVREGLRTIDRIAQVLPNAELKRDSIQTDFNGKAGDFVTALGGKPSPELDLIKSFSLNKDGKLAINLTEPKDLILFKIDKEVTGTLTANSTRNEIVIADLHGIDKPGWKERTPAKNMTMKVEERQNAEGQVQKFLICTVDKFPIANSPLTDEQARSFHKICQQLEKPEKNFIAIAAELAKNGDAERAKITDVLALSKGISIKRDGHYEVNFDGPMVMGFGNASRLDLDATLKGQLVTNKDGVNLEIAGARVAIDALPDSVKKALDAKDGIDLKSVGLKYIQPEQRILPSLAFEASVQMKNDTLKGIKWITDGQLGSPLGKDRNFESIQVHLEDNERRPVQAKIMITDKAGFDTSKIHGRVDLVGAPEAKEALGKKFLPDELADLAPVLRDVQAINRRTGQLDDAKNIAFGGLAFLALVEQSKTHRPYLQEVLEIERSGKGSFEYKGGNVLMGKRVSFGLHEEKKEDRTVFHDPEKNVIVRNEFEWKKQDIAIRGLAFDTLPLVDKAGLAGWMAVVPVGGNLMETYLKEGPYVYPHTLTIDKFHSLNQITDAQDPKKIFASAMDGCTASLQTDGFVRGIQASFDVQGNFQGGILNVANPSMFVPGDTVRVPLDPKIPKLVDAMKKQAQDFQKLFQQN